MSMQEYRKRVVRLARERNGEPILNGSSDHASIIVEQMFKNACKQVSILTGRLNARVYGRDEVLEEARLFLADKEHTLRILIEDLENLEIRDHPLVEELLGNSNVEVRELPSNYEEMNKYHFLVMDDDSYRFEPEKDKFAAVAAFGDKKGADSLLSVYEAFWATGVDVDLKQETVPVS